MKKNFRKLINLLYIRNPIKTYLNNTLTLESKLKSSRLKIDGISNYIHLENSKCRRLRIDINGNNNKVTIGKMNRISNLNIMIVGNNHQVTIGDNTDILGANFICCGNNNKITLGNDNLIAGNVELRNCDGHTIIKNGQMINPNKPIIIGNRVWLCANTTILKGVNLANDTVVGIGSLVTQGSYPNGIVLAGFPAKIIHEEIQWSGTCPS